MSHLNRVEAYAKGLTNFTLRDCAQATQGSETGTAARLRDLRQMGYTVTVTKVPGTKAQLYSVSAVRLAAPTIREKAAPAKAVTRQELHAAARKALHAEKLDYFGGRVKVTNAIADHLGIPA